MQYGVWDQIRVDHGTEFYLTLYVQEKLSAYRTNKRRAPFIQTTSKQVGMDSQHVKMIVFIVT